MKITQFLTLEYLPTLQNREEYFRKITTADNLTGTIINQYLVILFFSFLYGVIMGAYHGPLQAVAAGIKVAVLFTIALVICFPAFYIIQYILGSRLRLAVMISIILSGFILMTAIMIAFAPVVIIFLLTGSNYYFLQLLHIAIFLLAGIFGMQTVVDALKFSCEKKNVYPHTGVVVFRFWVIILAFVGIQLAWNFRPFLGDRGEPFQLFRTYEGNFYTALIYSVKKLVEDDIEDGRSTTAGHQRTGETLPYEPDPETDSLLESFIGDR